MENIALFIKRAEINQTKEFISKALFDAEYGYVNSIEFIPKKSDLGQPYNGAIVRFGRWFNSPKTKKLLTEMTDAGQAKLVFSQQPYKYWFVNIHKEQQLTIIDDNLDMGEGMPKTDQVMRLKSIIDSLKVQNMFYRREIERYEREQMEHENNLIRDSMLIVELKLLLDAKNRELEEKNAIIDSQNQESTNILVALDSLKAL